MKMTVIYTDGKSEEISVVHADKVRAELEQHRQGMPSLQHTPMTGVTLQVWAAARRLDKDTPADLYEWLDSIDTIEPVNDDIDEQTGAVVTDVNPRHTAAL